MKINIMVIFAKFESQKISEYREKCTKKRLPISEAAIIFLLF